MSPTSPKGVTVRFAELHLIEPLLRAVSEEGYSVATPIQVGAIPHVLAGRDLLGLAQTGTGKTAAFALPILQRLAKAGARPGGGGGRRPIRVLVVTPTRELASQIGDSFACYGRHLGLRHTVVFGGVGQRPQEQALARGIDILVATPGRLLDLLGQGFVHLQHLDVFVLDEADRMLDMGFLPDVRRIIAVLPKARQTLFFSATMPPEARRLADRLLTNPAHVSVVPATATADRIRQSVYFVEKDRKRALLVHLLADAAITRVLVFTRTKHGANRLADGLARAGIEAEAIHGDKSQGARERALSGFKAGRVRALVATDIAARGIDVEEISHVVNYDLPNVPESYVHRIGRTARAGASGTAFSFCARDERSYLAEIERTIRTRLAVTPIPALADGGERPTAPPDRPSHREPPRHREPSRRRETSRDGEPARPPVRLARPEAPPGDEPAWLRYSYASSARPPAAKPPRRRRRR